MSDTVILKYIGVQPELDADGQPLDRHLSPAGDHVPGVPARDLTQADWDALSAAEQQAVLSGPYEASSKKRATILAEEAGEAQQAEQAASGAAGGGK